MALRAGQGEVRVHDPARDAARLLPLRHVDRRVVLVGAGHAHALVLNRWAESAPPGIEVTVVTDRAEHLYSGMLPGLVAGEYRRDELVVDARTLAERAGARLIVDRVTAVHADARRIERAEGPPIDYDVASLNLGSTPRGLDTPGVREHAVPARPPDALVAALNALEADAASDTGAGGGSDTRAETRAVVVGGGAAGVELAAGLRGRLGPGSSVTLLEAGDRLMAGYRDAVAARVGRALERRGVDLRLGETVTAVDAGEVRTAHATYPSALTVWATGSAAPALLAGSGLPVDDNGFVTIDPTLHVRGHAELFAVGDCASLAERDVPKAGVHAVRQAPVLERNLRAWPAAAPARYDPQSDFLTLLNLGDGTALGTKWGVAAEGRWVRWIKDRIDRGFVERLQTGA